jgi:hypothetical protein
MGWQLVVGAAGETTPQQLRRVLQGHSLLAPGQVQAPQQLVVAHGLCLRVK